jgi:glyoxylate reductase
VRVVVTSPLPLSLPSEIAGARVEITDGLPADLRGVAGVICVLRDRIDAALLVRAPDLKIVANCAVGVDNIDLAACAAAGVAVANTPDVLTETTAELAIALALAVARRVGEGDRLVRSGAWVGWAPDQLLGVSLGTGATAGIVGMGRIGQAMARKCRALGMRVVFAGHREVTGWERVDLDDLFAQADVISLHCPLTPATRGLVDARKIGLMKPTAILVNTARGACVDDEALIAALAAGRIFGAGLDVFAHEPAVDPRYREIDRVVLAPHIGSATVATRAAMARMCVDAVEAVLAGRVPANVVSTDRG